MSIYQFRIYIFFVVVNFLAGGIAGVLSTFVCYPMDILRTRLVVQSNQMKVTLFYDLCNFL